MKRLALLACTIISLPAFASVEVVQTYQGRKIAAQNPYAVTATPAPSSETHLLNEGELKPAIDKKPPFVGGGGAKHLGEQMIFPVRHPAQFWNNCSHPFRHPVVAFSQYSGWVEKHNLNPGLSATASIASVASSIGIFGLYGKKFGTTNNVTVAK
jgi:hypothetical protein